MFCPTCGREEAQERKFCTACGTNLERVTKALSPSSDGIFTRADKAFDRWMARYAGMLFSSAANKTEDWRTSHSWQILGQSVLAALANIVLVAVMLYLAIPIRFVVLLFSAPFRLLAERSNKSRATADLPAPQWSADTIMPSVTDHATMKMNDPARQQRIRQ
ncbi:MAG TPA: zinc ribbon domain-containing protein [Blastocatellia bacterium]|nr:zinc ribbon domain-containing protein [Blastocatellia bacterium]